MNAGKRTVHEIAFRLSFDMQTHMAGRVGDFGIELTQLKMRILRVIWSQSDATAKDVVQVVKRDKGQVARLLDDLVRQGLVQREVDPNDRRSKILKLTSRGGEIFQSVEEIERSIASSLTQGIDAAELDIFFRVADQISENLKTM